MDFFDIQKEIENNQDMIETAKLYLKKYKSQLKQTTDESKKEKIEKKISETKKEILEYEKTDYDLKGQMRNIELQQMRKELNLQLESGMITQQEFDFKSEKLKIMINIQELYTDAKISECDTKIKKIISKEKGEVESFSQYYELSRKETWQKQDLFAEEKQRLEILKLTHQRDTRQISEEEYIEKSQKLKQELNIEDGLRNFETSYDDFKKDVYAPQLERKQTLETISKMKPIMKKNPEYFEDVFLDYVAQRVAENTKNIDDLRKSAPVYQNLPDYDLDQIDDLKAHIKNELSYIIPDELEIFIKNGSKEIKIPTVNGKYIILPKKGFETLIRDFGKIMDEKSKNSTVQKSQERSLKHEKESSSVRFSEPNEALRREKRTPMPKSEKTSAKDYMEKKSQLFFSMYGGSDDKNRTEELRREVEDMESSFSEEELRRMSEGVRADDKEQAERGVNGQIERSKRSRLK